MGFFDDQVGVKVLATTVGETFADFLNGNVGLGLGGTSGTMLAILLVSLAVQMKLDFYYPPLYWFVIVTISTRNLSIHEIFTRRREAWYWLVVLVTFALGTSAGDLVAEQLNLGYGNSMLLFAGCIAVMGLLLWFKKINGVLGFWVVYVLTRPLGASLGDLMSQNPADSVDTGSGPGSGSSSSSSASASMSGDAPAEELPSMWKAGLNLGTTITSMIFLGLIAILVIFLTITKKDKLKVAVDDADLEKGPTAKAVSPTSVNQDWTTLRD
ncbi:hypothetical protein V7S43_005524 [Phytophthora oleae]|uniref:DUF4203 domain-containing protein n=1 Tax=Phytophthora oleae TaxID=2107226 RepID=A0ABD3FTW4_9STRA